ncbi:hypothetical protein OCS_04348 [Ophiocordyceps sinensis CO18]|uniref:Uncharacterized protein n=1 Tax=Ophiocordyceps sinensis (strain Co18 / CGMCC 3.14243) TaxID=911162 RepID=T5ABH7_OPHSC|nr:hypothetical protein OCS_04348 [Ophiocordyceps sinensis CO18]
MSAGLGDSASARDGALPSAPMGGGVGPDADRATGFATSSCAVGGWWPGLGECGFSLPSSASQENLFRESDSFTRTFSSNAEVSDGASTTHLLSSVVARGEAA